MKAFNSFGPNKAWVKRLLAPCLQSELVNWNLRHNVVSKQTAQDTHRKKQTKQETAANYLHLCASCHQHCCTGQRPVMLHGWKGNRRSGIILVMGHWLSDISTSTYGLM